MDETEALEFIELELLDGKAVMYLSDQTMLILSAKEVATLRPERVRVPERKTGE